MDRSENVFPNNTFRNHNCILIVITLPWHESYFQVTSQSQFSTLRSISFRKYLAFCNTIAFLNDRFKIDNSTLVGFLEFRNLTGNHLRVEAYKTFFFTAVITDQD